MSNRDEPKDLLAELEMLQRVLDNESSDSPEHAAIPVLDDLFEEKASAPATPLRAVPVLKPTAPAQVAPVPERVSSVSSLSQVLDHISKRTAANVDEPTPRPSVNSPLNPAMQKRAEIDQTMSETSASLVNLLKRERMVDELVEEMMPLLKGRLRSRIRDLLEKGE
ncbi:hypothetical protein [Thalassolituus sp.]|jgi:hypothetical protein|uniref:hypothetical protein n=1 Tax=Thalassolituus sp. TaxID=2030822 RepID=UPI0026234E40|nr:hypothetical protein [uncultured Thalassolituus sp.]